MPVDNNRPEEPDHKEVVLCPGCVQPVDPAQNFCPLCNTPLNSITTIDPIMQLQTYGYFVTKITDRSRLAGLLLAAWFFLLQFFMGYILQFITQETSLGQLLYWVFSISGFALIVVGGAVLTMRLFRALPH